MVLFVFLIGPFIGAMLGIFLVGSSIFVGAMIGVSLVVVGLVLFNELLPVLVIVGIIWGMSRLGSDGSSRSDSVFK